MTRRSLQRKKGSPASRNERHTGTVIDAILSWIVAATVVVTPVIISVSGRDEFRAPKEYVLHAGGILVLAMLAIRSVYFPRDTLELLRRYRAAFTLALAVVVWTAVTTAMSTNVVLSFSSLLRVVSSAAFFVGAVLAVRNRFRSAIYVLLAPAVINTVVLLLQLIGWDPIYGPSARPVLSALVGSSNDVGAYLLAPAIGAAALAVASRERRLLHLFLTAFLSAGILGARSAAAIGAYAVAIAALGALLSLRRALTFAGAMFILIAIGVATLTPLRNRALTVRQAVESRDYNLLSSYRLTPWVAALHMFRHDPLTGAGPGTYEWNYFDYKIAAEEHYKILQQPGDHRLFMFGAAHSDHLQILAVSGLPGYLLFVGSLVLLGSFSRKREETEPAANRKVARKLALPLAAGTATIALAQFPLELAASLVALLYAAAICVSWSVRENP